MSFIADNTDRLASLRTSWTPLRRRALRPGIIAGSRRCRGVQQARAAAAARPGDGRAGSRKQVAD